MSRKSRQRIKFTYTDISAQIEYFVDDILLFRFLVYFEEEKIYCTIPSFLETNYNFKTNNNYNNFLFYIPIPSIIWDWYVIFWCKGEKPSYPPHLIKEKNLFFLDDPLLVVS